MQKNMGAADRIIRLIVGLFIFSLVFWGPTSYWGLLGLILVATAIFGFCPIYYPFKISTKKKQA